MLVERERRRGVASTVTGASKTLGHAGYVQGSAIEQRVVASASVVSAQGPSLPAELACASPPAATGIRRPAAGGARGCSPCKHATGRRNESRGGNGGWFPGAAAADASAPAADANAGSDGCDAAGRANDDAWRARIDAAWRCFRTSSAALTGSGFRVPSWRRQSSRGSRQARPRHSPRRTALRG